MLPTFADGEAVPWADILPAQVKRGDVVIYLFKRQLRIHRVIGMPGETVAYADATGQWLIDDKPIRHIDAGRLTLEGVDYRVDVETLGGRSHRVIDDPRHPSLAALAASMPLMQVKGSCQWNEGSFLCNVPAGYVFVIGDNRKNSTYGLVALEDIIGIAKEPDGTPEK